MAGWKDQRPRDLKKVVYALNEHRLQKVVGDHESRGWAKASEIKEHNYGVGVLMVWHRQ